MANEAVLKLRTHNPIDFTILDTNSAEKGQVMALFDPRLVSGAALMARDTQIAGIAAREKVASDGRTQLAIFRDGIFDMVTSGAAITKGNPLGAVTSGTDINKVFIADATASGANIIGTALEDAAAGETIEVHVRI